MGRIANPSVRLIFMLCVVFVFILVGCGDKGVSIGEAGGTVSSADGSAVLVVPEGSLSEVITVKIKPEKSPPEGTLGKVYHIGPSGTQFNPSAELTLRYDAAIIPKGMDAADLAVVTYENEQWVELTTKLGNDGEELIASVPHLSLFGIMGGAGAGAGAGNVVYTCSDVEFSIKEGKPFAEVKLSAVPTSFDEHLAFKVTAVDDGSSLYAPVRRADQGNGGAIFNVPPHPSGNMLGGKVMLEFTDGDSQPCDPVAFMILPLPHSPGAYAKLVALLDELNKEVGRVFGSSQGQQGVVTASGGSPMDLPTNIIDDLIRGDHNPNSLEDLSDGTAPAVEGMSEDEQDLTDGLIEESGILDELEGLLDELKRKDPVKSEDKAGDKGGSGDQGNQGGQGGKGDQGGSGDQGGTGNQGEDKQKNWCDSSFYSPDAATLDAMMYVQVSSEIYGNDTGLLDASGLLWSGAAILATGAGAKPLAKGFASISSAIGTFKTMTGALEGILPDELVSLNFDYDPETFLEDDIELDGEWSNARLTARSKGWSGDQALAEMLFNAAAGNITKSWLKHFDVGGVAGDIILDISNALSGVASSFAFKDMSKTTGALKIPSCEFGPTDISEEPWSIATIRDEANAPAYMVDRYKYRARETGEAILEIKPNGNKFGRRSFNSRGEFIYKEEVIEILPIEVVVTPDDVRGEPGETVVFVATVNNANDKGVAWNITPQGGHQMSVETRADGTSVLTVVTSKSKADYPATVTATSMSNKGLRALPDAPPREGYALIRGNQADIKITPDTCCVEFGETETFTAIIHNADNQEVTWEASAGKITSSGVFTAPEENGIVTITATSVANPNVQGFAEVIVREDCDCWSLWSLGMGESGVGYVSNIERAGNDGEGRLTKLRFINDETEFAYEVVILGEGPLPGESGQYRVIVLSSVNEMTGNPIVFHNGSATGPVVVELDQKVYLQIDEFIQLGSEPHHVQLKGSLNGQVLSAYLKEVENAITGLGDFDVHKVTGFNASFGGYYKVRRNNPMAALAAIIGGTKYWDYCGFEEHEKPENLFDFPDMPDFDLPPDFEMPDFGDIKLPF